MLVATLYNALNLKFCIAGPDDVLLSKTKLTPDYTSYFSDKALLMRLSQLDEQLISYSENLLSAGEKESFLLSLQNNAAAVKDLELFKNARLIPDSAIKYPHKENLKRNAIIVFLKSKTVSMSIAASLLLFFALYYSVFEETGNKYKLADNNKPLKQIKNKNALTNNIQEQVHSKRAYTAVQLMQEQQTSIKNTNTISDETPLVVPELPIVSEENTLAITTEEVCVENTCSPQETVNINHYKEQDDVYVSKKESAEAPLSISEKIETAIWKQKGDASTKVEANNKKSTKMNLLALLATGLRKLGNKNSGAEKIYHEEEGYTEYNVTIAGISISKKQLN